MTTTIDEIGPGIYRISSFVPEIAAPDGFTFNEFLIDAEEPMLFHLGSKAFFPEIADAVRTVMPLERLRWLSFGHFEADECGSMNQWLQAAPNATVAFNGLGVMLSVGDAADRPPRAVDADEVLDLGGRRVRMIPTPHVPHNWEAQVLWEEMTSTLFAGDLCTHFGNAGPVTSGDIVGAALAAEGLNGLGLTPATAPTMRALADLGPSTLALMHGTSFTGDGARPLRDLADEYERHLEKAVGISFTR